MSIGDWALVGFLIIAVIAIGGLWIATRPEIEDPPGTTIGHFDQIGWNYIIEDDRKAMLGTGYLTRRSAIRAANAALKEAEKRQPS